MCITKELDKYLYNLENFTITQCILDFLNKSGIEQSEYDRVSKINESNDILLEENRQLKSLFEESININNIVNKQNKNLSNFLLYFRNNKNKLNLLK